MTLLENFPQDEQKYRIGIGRDVLKFSGLTEGRREWLVSSSGLYLASYAYQSCTLLAARRLQSILLQWDQTSVNNYFMRTKVQLWPKDSRLAQQVRYDLPTV